MGRRSFHFGVLLRALACASTLTWFSAAEAAATAVQLTDSGSLYSVKVMTFRDIPFRTVIRQQYDYSCGSASLATLLHFHYGRPVGEAASWLKILIAFDLVFVLACMLAFPHTIEE